MLFNKSLLIACALAGASAVGVGGYFGVSALDSHFSQQSEDVLSNPEVTEGNQLPSRVDSNEEEQTRRESPSGDSSGHQSSLDSSVSDERIATTGSPNSEQRLNSEDSVQTGVTADGEVLGGATAGAVGSDGVVHTEQQTQTTPVLQASNTPVVNQLAATTRQASDSEGPEKTKEQENEAKVEATNQPSSPSSVAGSQQLQAKEDASAETEQKSASGSEDGTEGGSVDTQ